MQGRVDLIASRESDLRCRKWLSSLQRSLTYARKLLGAIGRSHDNRASLFTKRRWRKLEQQSASDQTKFVTLFLVLYSLAIGQSSMLYVFSNTHFKLHQFNGLFSRTTWVSRYEKGKTSLDINEARDDGVLGLLLQGT